MMRKLVLTLAAVFALGSVFLATEASAFGHGGGHGGGGHGGGGFHGGGGAHFGGFHGGGIHFGGFRGIHVGGIHGFRLGGFHRAFAFHRGYAFHRPFAFHRHYYAFHRHFFRPRVAIGVPYYWHRGCWRWRHVLTPWGWRVHRVNVCGYRHWHRYWY